MVIQSEDGIWNPDNIISIRFVTPATAQADKDYVQATVRFTDGSEECWTIDSKSMKELKSNLVPKIKINLIACLRKSV